MIAAGIILFLLALAIELVIDYKAFLKARIVKHKTKPVKRFFMLLPSILCFTANHPFNWYEAMPIVIIMQAAVWWLLFDGLYNIIRNYPWWFNGGHNDPTEPDSSTLDKWLSKLSDKQEAALKIALAVSSIIVYIKTN